MKKVSVYFLCTGNSCRSQMAEGWMKHRYGDRFEVYSAGIEQHGLNPRAVQAMRDAGVDISQQTSDVIDDERLQSVDYVITLCGDANDKCPVTPPHVLRLHWGLEDPAKAQGTEEEIMEKFYHVRDTIRQQIDDFVQTIFKD